MKHEALVQLFQSVHTLGAMLKTYQDALEEAGFSREEAFSLVRDFARTLKPSPQLPGDEWKS